MVMMRVMRCDVILWTASIVPGRQRCKRRWMNWKLSRYETIQCCRGWDHGGIWWDGLRWSRMAWGNRDAINQQPLPQKETATMRI